MQTVDREADNQHSYERLMVSLEASQGKLDLLIAVCDDPNLQEAITQQYATELQHQGITHHRVFVRRQDASLRYALEQLVQEKPELQHESSGVVTVQGLGDLLAFRLGAETSEQERLLGYLQWTREALREFSFPVVIWVSRALLVQLAEKAPDFWSWRGGVFWFTGETDALQLVESVASAPQKVALAKAIEPDLAALLQWIEQLEQQQGRDAPQLASLYERLGQVYAQRGDSGTHRQFAIQAYRRAIQLQRKQASKAELAESLEQLGNLYFELKDNVKQALEAYEEAIGIYREVGDRLGEANTLKAIGDVLQFLKRSTEALQNYEQAIGIYREVGDRLGEANTLKAIGDVLQFLKRSTEALQNYEQAIGIYREVGDRLGEANTLQAMGVVHNKPDEGLKYCRNALDIYRQIGDVYSQSRNLIYFTPRVLWQLKQYAEIESCLLNGIKLAQEISYLPFVEDAEAMLVSIQQPNLPQRWQWLIHFLQRGWKRFVLLGLVAFILVLIVKLIFLS
jgi:tetratricopeptide (TPR) repeat protein